jgi:ribosomal-protein-alanine acetyltransferase
MEPSDIGAVIAIQSVSPEIAQWTAADYDLANRPGTAGWVAEQQTRIAGFLVARLVFDEIEILNIAIHPACRCEGLGSELLRTVLKDASARGAAMAYLEVRASNRPAIEFYKRHGFRTLQRRVQYYASPAEDAFILALRVDKNIGMR